MTMTRNRSLDKSRAQNLRRVDALDNAADRLASGLPPAQETESRDLIARIRRMMQHLPEKQRLVMHLRCSIFPLTR